MFHIGFSLILVFQYRDFLCMHKKYPPKNYGGVFQYLDFLCSLIISTVFCTYMKPYMKTYNVSYYTQMHIRMGIIRDLLHIVLCIKNLTLLQRFRKYF